MRDGVWIRIVRMRCRMSSPLERKLARITERKNLLPYAVGSRILAVDAGTLGEVQKLKYDLLQV